MRNVHIFILFSTILATEWTNCFIVTPERLTVEYVNPKFIVDAKLNIQRYGRRSPYYINLNATLLVELNNNMTLHIVFFEYLHNEYKRSFVEWHYKFCDLMNKDPLIGGMLKLTGRVDCPLRPGRLELQNMTVPSAKMNIVWPFEKCRADITLTQTYTNDTIGNGFIFLSFVNKIKKG